MKEHFYILMPDGNELFGTKYVHGQMGDPYTLGDCEHCPKCHSAASLLRWLPPHNLELSSSIPSKWGDFVFGADYHPFISANFKRIFEQERLKGLVIFHQTAKIIKLGTKRARNISVPLPIYHMMEIPHEGAEIDVDASHMVHETHSKCDKCIDSGIGAKSYKGLVIKEDSWAGYDIFRAWGGMSHIFVTEKFKSVIEKYKLTNYLLYPADQLWWEEPNLNPFYTYKDREKAEKRFQKYLKKHNLPSDMRFEVKLVDSKENSEKKWFN